MLATTSLFRYFFLFHSMPFLVIPQDRNLCPIFCSSSILKVDFWRAVDPAGVEPASRTHFGHTSSPRCAEFCRDARRDEETVARATAPRSNDTSRQKNRNPSGPVRLPQCLRRFELAVSLRIRLRSCSLALWQSARVADGDMRETGSWRTFLLAPIPSGHCAPTRI